MPQVVVIDPAESEKISSLELQRQDIAERAKLIRVENAAQYESAGEYLRDVMDMAKEIRAQVDPVCERTNAAHKEATGLRARLLEPLLIAEKLVKRVMSAYATERDRQARIEAQLAQEAAAKAIADARIDRAVDLEAAGRLPEAERLLATPIKPVVTVNAAPPKVDGLATRKTWRYEVVDAASISRDFLMIDEKKIAGLVKVVGEDAVKLVGGIRVYQETDVIGAGGRIG